MSEGFKGGKIPPLTNFKSIKELLCVSSEVMTKKVEDSIVCQVHLKYDTQATIQSIIERLQYADKLEKALDKACEYIAELTGSCPYDVHEVELDYCVDCQTECAKCWKEWCMKDD